jgi:uncharacterized membrane protein YedE/YeeE
MNILTQPWPWYIAGPLIGLMVPLMLLFGKTFGISSTLRHICAACIPGKHEFFNYNWREHKWNLYFAFGIIAGAFLAGNIFQNPNPVQLSESAVASMNEYGIKNYSGLAPQEIFNWILLIVVGGFFVGFGTRYAGGCTSGHSIMGISNLQLPSLIATCCFFAGGLVMTWIVLPYIFKL